MKDNETWGHRRWFSWGFAKKSLGFGFTVQRTGCTGSSYGEDGWDMLFGVQAHLLGVHVTYRHAWKQDWIMVLGEQRRWIWQDVVAEAQARTVQAMFPIFNTSPSKKDDLPS